MSLVPQESLHAEIIDSQGEVFDLRNHPSAIEAVTRTEIDIQIATAKRFPRQLSKFITDAKGMVSVSPELAEKCTYVLPGRKKKDEATGKFVPISGPSVRLAEMLACCWKNIRVSGRVIDDDGKAITAQGVCMDLESNIGYSVEVRRGVMTKDGRRYSEDMVNMTCNAAIALATRNATFKTIPRAFVNLIEEYAREVARGDVATLPARVDRAIRHFSGLGVSEKEVYAALEVAGAADITLDHLQTLNGFKNSVTEGLATVEEIFRPTPQFTVSSPPPETKVDSLKRKMGVKAKEEPEPQSEPSYILDGKPVTVAELVKIARDAYKFEGSDAAGAAFILREENHKVELVGSKS